jgi:two-component system, NtrC family, nitrogen regulation sensor histidine kinase NtrY
MKIRTKFILFSVIIHVIFLLLVIPLLKGNKYLFLLAEVLIVSSFLISLRILRSFIRPLDLIAAGIETIREKDFSVKIAKVGQYEMDMLIEVYGMMIDQLREERIKQQEKHFFLEQLVQASTSGIIVLDFEGRISMLNPVAAQQMGVNPTLATGSGLLTLPSALAPELASLLPDETRVVHLPGFRIFRCRKSHFIDRGFRHHFILVEEITSEIQQSEKLVYEKMIKIMSHEVNNSIGGINSILQSCLSYKDQLTQADREDYEEALNVAILRNKNLSGFMSNLADMVRLPAPVREACDMNALLKYVFVLIGHKSEKDITWNWALSNPPLMVELDVQQMEQVMVNIIKNAMEAIEEAGIITLETSLTPRRLIIKNNGAEIPNEKENIIFTPFYTSKKEGQGLGLALTREILNNHGFEFTLKTNEGTTAFTIGF